MAKEAGFELILPDDTEATFFPLDLSHTSAKALQIIDRCTQMPLEEFEEVFDDPRQRGRWPIAQAMIGLSIRAARPSWSVERIMDIVDNLDLEESQLAFLNGDEEGKKEDPLSGSESGRQPGNGSPSPSDESSQSAAEQSSQAETPSDLSNVTPV